MKTAGLRIALILGVMAAAGAQDKKPADISTVAASGAVSGNRYTNSFFTLSVDAPNATLQLNPLINTAAERARLMQVMAQPAKWEDTYTIAVLADFPDQVPSIAVSSSIRAQRSAFCLLTRKPPRKTNSRN
jgi:hypothetical protein